MVVDLEFVWFHMITTICRIVYYLFVICNEWASWTELTHWWNDKISTMAVPNFCRNRIKSSVTKVNSSLLNCIFDGTVNLESTFDFLIQIYLILSSIRIINCIHITMLFKIGFYFWRDRSIPNQLPITLYIEPRNCITNKATIQIILERK